MKPTYPIPPNVSADLLAPYSAQPVRHCTGGLSQAQVFQCTSSQGLLCLRRWPAGRRLEQLLSIVDATQRARQAGLSFVPLYLRSPSGGVLIPAGEHHWELTEWMPGVADYSKAPSLARLESALEALGKLHRCWSQSSHRAVSPAVTLRRQLLLKHLHPATQAAWAAQVNSIEDAELAPLHAATVAHLNRLGPGWLLELESLAQRPTPVFFCVRDVWSDHVLFSGDRVTGLIDYGAARIDEPATDVARLLGSLEPQSTMRREAGLRAYRQWQPNLDVHRVDALDRVSCLLSAVQWLVWLVAERRQFPVPQAAVLTRWRGFVNRLKGW